MSEWFKEHDWKSCVGGSSPQVQILFSAPNKKDTFFAYLFYFCVPNFEQDLRVGAVLREQNTLPPHLSITNNSTAKATIVNRCAGRAAKGENPVLCAK